MKKTLFFLTVLFILFITSRVEAQGPFLGAGLVYNHPVGSDVDYLDPGLALN